MRYDAGVFSKTQVLKLFLKMLLKIDNIYKDILRNVHIYSKCRKPPLSKVIESVRESNENHSSTRMKTSKDTLVKNLKI